MSRTKIKPKKSRRIPRAISVIEIQILDNSSFAMQTKVRPGLDQKTIAAVDKVLAGLKEFLAPGLPVVEDQRLPLIEVVK
jgi:hypothetical protein